MKLHFVCWLFLVEVNFLSANAQQAQQKSSSPKSSPAPAAVAQQQPGPEMQKLFNAFVGTWSLTEKIEPTESTPNGGSGYGEVTSRPGPGAHSFIEEIHLVEPTRESIGLGLAWWDEKAGGYRTVWCENGIAGGCIVMARLAKWEGDQFVAGDEFERNGKRFIFKEVLSEITSTSYTQTLYQGEAGKELKKLATIHATRSAR